MQFTLRSLKVAALALPLLAVPAIALPAPAFAGISIGISVNFGPPAIPVYVQPPVPVPNYLWMPGYWAWGPGGYYWVPGTWVLAPRPGLLWTPGYWAYRHHRYWWNAGYWAPSVGFYGGINYGYGYFGSGYVGGDWDDGAFRYNRAVTNVNTTIVRNVYVNRTVIVNNFGDRVSYNGGPHGYRAVPDARQLAVMHEHRYAPTNAQRAHVGAAAGKRSLFAKVNGGRPRTAAVDRPFAAGPRGGDVPPHRPQLHVRQTHVKQTHGPQMHAAQMHGRQVHGGPSSGQRGPARQRRSQLGGGGHGHGP